MPHSQFYDTCNHCRNQYISNDSREFRCGSCRRKGHTADWRTCPICNGKEIEGKDPIADLDTIISMLPKRYG